MFLGTRYTHFKHFHLLQSYYFSYIFRFSLLGHVHIFFALYKLSFAGIIIFMVFMESFFSVSVKLLPEHTSSMQ